MFCFSMPFFSLAFIFLVPTPALVCCLIGATRHLLLCFSLSLTINTNQRGSMQNQTRQYFHFKSSSRRQALFLISMPEHILSSFLLKLSLASTSYRPAKMKSKVAIFFKQMTAAAAAIVRSKSDALKNKAIAMKTRLIIFRLLHSKKVLLSALSTKMHSLMNKEFKLGEASSQSIVMFNGAKVEECPNLQRIEAVEYDEDEDYPDLRHTLFDLQDEEQEIDDGLLNSTVSVVDWVRNTRDDGAEFNLEDEIDHVADVFIKRFHWQMMLEKQESIKRYREMLEGSV